MTVSRFGVLFFLFSSVSWAGTDYLPPSKDPAELQDQVNAIQQILPFSARNNVGLVQIQHNGLAALRNQFSDFDKWAAAKPDPITIAIEQKATRNEMSYVLNAAQFGKLQSSVFDELQHLESTIEKAGGVVTLDLLRQKTVALIGESLLSGADSLRGLITGVLQVLPADKKAAIFKSGDPTVQLQMLRELQLTNDVLRSGSFQAERFGMNSKTVTVQEVLSQIERKLNVHQEFLVQLGLYTVLTRMNNDDLAQIKFKKGEVKNSLLTIGDFAFLEKGEGAILSSLEAELMQRFPKFESKLKKALAQSVSAVPKQWFERKMMAIEVTTPYIKVVEVHPYLGVYRGCIGGDCSTGSSPMYPFSPWEHVFYVLGNRDEFIGYISATRVEIGDGKKALYLKDLSGRTLSADVAEVILHAFGQVYKYYGVETFLIANSRFTDTQNHFPQLRERYAKYNGRTPVSGKVPQIVNVTFPDNEVRTFIQNQREIFFSGAGYDNANMHTTGAVFVPQLDMTGFKVSYRQGTLSAFKPQTPRESLLYALRLLSADENAKINEIPGLVETEVRNVMHKLKNSEGSDLATYYKRIAEIFGRYGIELSRSFRQQQEIFFIEGHVMASDAFSVTDESMRVDSEKFFVTYCRRNKDFAKIGNLAKKWSAQFNQSKRVTDLINLYASRAENADIMALITFAAEKNVRAQEILKDEKLAGRREAVLNEYIFSDKLGKFGININDSSVAYLRSLIVHHESTPADLIEAGLRTSLANLGLKLENLTNKDFIRNLNLTIMQASGAFNGGSESSVTRMRNFVSEYESGRIEIGVFLSRLILLSLEEPQSRALAFALERRMAAYKKAPRDSVPLAIEAFILGIVLQKPMVANSHFSPAMNQLLKDWITRENKDNVAPKVLKDIIETMRNTQASNYILQIYRPLQNVETYLTKHQKGTLDSFYQNLNDQLRVLGTEAKNLWAEPVLKRALANMHVRYPEAFDVNQKESFARSMAWTTEMVFSGEDFERSVGMMIKQIKTVRETPQFKKFVERVVEASERGSSPVIFRVLVQLLAAGAIDESTKISKESLQELMKLDDPYVKTFAAAQLLEKNPRVEFAVEDLRTISKLLANSDADKMPDVLLVFSAKAMDILLRTRVNDEQIQKELLETVAEDDNMKMVFKAAIAYIKNGGDIKEVDELIAKALQEEDHRLAKKEAKRAQAENREPRKVAAGAYLKLATAPIRTLYEFYGRVKKDPNATMESMNDEGQLRSCQTVFLRAKFLGY